MLIAIISDIHSNPFALEAVLADSHFGQVDRVLFLGDAFGYYPWAAETWRLLQAIDVTGVLGNHDALVLRAESNEDESLCPSIAKINAQQLRRDCPDAIDWLSKLPLTIHISVDSVNISLVHGTPLRPLEGRFYPDDTSEYDWFPNSPDEILLLGHTHYPVLKVVDSGGIVANPGSVGQPRDGDQRAAWALLDSKEGTIELRRTPYDLIPVIDELSSRAWPERAIAAFKKSRPGALDL